MSLAVKGTFSACKDGEYYSMSYICSGSEDDCATIQTLPDLTCEYSHGKLTCSNGVTCPDDSGFTTNVDIVFDQNNVSFIKEVSSPDCSFSLSKAKAANSSVVLEGGDECGKSQPVSGSQSSRTSTISGRMSSQSRASAPSHTTPILLSNSSVSITPATRTAKTVQNSLMACTASPCSPTAIVSGTSLVTGTSSYPKSTSTSPIVVVSGANKFKLTKAMFLLTFLSMLLLFVPGSVASVLNSPREVLERDTIGSEFVARDTHSFASETALEPRTLVEDVLKWRGLFRPTTPVAEGLDLRKMYSLFRGITLRDGERLTGSAVDWILLGEDAWEEFVITIQEVACAAAVNEFETKTWQAKTIKPILDAATKQCIHRAEIRIMAALKDPKTYFKGFKSAPSIIVGTYVVCDAVVNLSWKLLKGALPPGTVPNWAKDACTGKCYEYASARLTDPDNCGTCGNKCESGTCINGACVVGACANAAGPDGTLIRCSSGDNYNTCACVNVDTAVGMCVQYSSLAYDAITNSCEDSKECDRGQICASFPGSNGGKSCLEATSCLKSNVPSFPTEKIPSKLIPGSPVEPGSHQVWRLRVSDENYQVKWAENPVHLNSLARNYLVKNSAGKTTVNTKCVSVRLSGERTGAGAGAIGSIPDVTYLPKGRDFYFGYDSEDLLNSESKDTCRFKLYDNDDCSGDGWGGDGIWITSLPFDALAFQVEGCEMLLPM